METAESDNPDAKSTEDDFDSMEVLVRIELNMIEQKMVDLRLDFVAFAEQQFGHVDSHSLVRIEPVIGSKYQYISLIHRLNIMTPYLGRMMGMNATVRARMEAKETYDMLLGAPQMRNAKGWVFEGRVHSYLHRGDITLFCKQLDGKGKLLLSVRPGDTSFSSYSELSDKLRAKPGSTKFNRDLLSVHLWPNRMNVTAIDSLMVTMVNGVLRAVLFQITINQKHGLKTDGLQAA
jgi:hypothetical protein